jgi:hypothetical protein
MEGNIRGYSLKNNLNSNTVGAALWDQDNGINWLIGSDLSRLTNPKLLIHT